MTTVTISEPGLYDIAETDYHADNHLAPELGMSLSSTGAKAILDCPARFHWQRTHRVEKDAFDKGTIAHALILNNPDPRLRIVDCYGWTLKKDQEARKAIRADGNVAVSRADLLAASKMARAVRRHRLASAIFSEGKAEQSFYWIDEATGVTCRGRVDWLRDNAIVDLKTISKADPRTITRQSYDYGYAQQADFYRRGIHAVTGQWLPFVHVFVESDEPHIVHVAQLDEDFLAIGSDRNDQALALYAECQSSDHWPAYGDDITLISPPAWAK